MRTGDGLPAMTLCNGRALPVVTVLLRAIVACGVVLVLVRLWLGITSLHGGLAFWAMPILLSGFGFVVARWWALLLPPVLAIALPWYELHTGYLAFRSAEDSPGWTLLVMLSSLLCVALGVALSHGLSAAVRPLFPRSALYRDGIALALCLFCVLSAVMPPWHAGTGLLDPRPIARLGPPPPVAPAVLRARVTGVPYAVYGMPYSAAPSSAARAVSQDAGSDSFAVTYRLSPHGRDNYVAVLSSSRACRCATFFGDEMPVAIDGAMWWETVRGRPDRFQASTNLDDAFVTIDAPNRMVFERFVIALQRLN